MLSNTLPVVCAVLEAGNVQYFSILGGFTKNVATAWFGKKEDIFDKVSDLPEWEEIAGRTVFLDKSELMEIMEDNRTFVEATFPA